MSFKLLSEQEEHKVKQYAEAFYNKLKQSDVLNSNRLFGIEVEFSIINNKNKLQPMFSELLSEKISDHYIVPELGSYQIEINPPPLPLIKGCFNSFYNTLQQSRTLLEKNAKQHQVEIIPIGIPFYIQSDLFQNLNQNFTQKNRYLVSAHYFGDYNKDGLFVPYKNGDGFLLPGDTGVTIINELHVQIQSLNIEDLMNLFNYSQLITAPFICLGANSGITNGLELTNIEHQIEIFEKSEGVFDGKPGFPRVGFFPSYIHSLDEYIDIALSFKPLYYPTDEEGSTAFDLMLGIYYGWTRIRYGITPTPHFRIEFRPLSVQPTMIENIALSECYIKSLLTLMNAKVPLLPEHYLKNNFKEAIKEGMDAHLFWNLGKGVNKYPVHEILQWIIEKTSDGEFLEIMKKRIQKKQSPTQKLISETKRIGYTRAIEQYKKCFQNEIPYI